MEITLWIYPSALKIVLMKLFKTPFFSAEPEAVAGPGKELQRPRLDTGRNIFTQLTSVFDDIPSQPKAKPDGPVETVNTDGDTTIVHIPDTADEVCYMA